MNTLKQYAKERMKEFKLLKPISYENTFYRTIKGIEDIEDQFKYAENTIIGCEKESNACRLPDYEELDLAVYKVFKAVEKATMCMSEISVIKDNSYDTITQKQFDLWCEKLHDLINRKSTQTSRYISRPS